MAIEEYTDPEYTDDAPNSMDPEAAAAWQFEDERQYREALAFSYPQDALARFSQWWLGRYA